VVRIWCERALVDGRVSGGVLIDVDRATGRFAGVEIGRDAADGDERRFGVTLPGAANTHSHAFHRVLRHRSQTGRGSFWTWRDQMYAVAGVLDPDSYHRLARAVFAEMALAGYVVVGEFHYLHHQPDGTPYDEPNAMGDALVAAATDVGVRITLLDTLYLHGGLGGDSYAPPSPMQSRFADTSVVAWCELVYSI
jgi:cytosine/adenosine deaminase-related metal-dependent hydrolase